MRRAVFAVPGDLATVTGGYLYERRLLEGLRDVGTEVVHVPLGDSFPEPTDEDHRHAVAALSAVDAGTPLILDGFVFGSLDPSAMAALRAPVVGVVHHPLAFEEGLPEDRRARLFESERMNLEVAAAVLVPSRHTARMLVEHYGADPSKITVVRPGTDRATSAAAPVDPPLILSVGIQHPRKGHDVLLRALSLVTDLQWNAVIAGTPYDTRYGEELQNLCAGLGLTGRVRLAGGVSVDEREALYSAAGVFALATRYEGYGLVFDEALVRGLPIVSCRTGAVPETVPDTAGVLVPPDDPVSFAAGAMLPGWLDTARTAQRVLDALAPAE